MEGLEKCSGFAVDATEGGDFDYVLVAGDLNITEDYLILDPDPEEEEEVEVEVEVEVRFLERYFQGFAGVSENLDHIFCWPDLRLHYISGYNFTTSSDHNLLYGRFQIGY